MDRNKQAAIKSNGTSEEHQRQQQQLQLTPQHYHHHQQQQQQQQLQHMHEQLQRLQQQVHEAQQEEEISMDLDAYDADVDDEATAGISIGIVGVVGGVSGVVDECSVAGVSRNVVAAAVPSLQSQKLQAERDHIFELFQPWALKTYGDHAKTKTITLRKKVRILKALEGKEHSRPDSSKFRFWVKTKGFTTKRPETFSETPGSRRRSPQLPADAVLSDHAREVDLFVMSTNKESGKRIHRKVSVVEEFFDIIYGVHMELGGRSGMHAGQKRTYRIISETYAFLPREAVTRFLSTCPECKKNLRPSSPAVSSHTEEAAPNESSSEVEVLNYSSHTESSAEAGPTTSKTKKRRHTTERQRSADSFTGGVSLPSESAVELSVTVPEIATTTTRRHTSPPIVEPTTKTKLTTNVPERPASVPRIRVNPLLQQRSVTPPSLPSLPSLPPLPTLPLLSRSEPVLQQPLSFSLPPYGFDVQTALATRAGSDSFLRYYEFMRRFYAGGFGPAMGVALPPSGMYESELLHSLRLPTATTSKTVTKAQQRHDDEEEEQEQEIGITVPLPAKKFKPDPTLPPTAHTLTLPTTTQNPLIIPSTTAAVAIPQTSAINLSKFFRSNGNKTATPLTSTPTNIKWEKVTASPTYSKTTMTTATTAASAPGTSTKREALRVPKLTSTSSTTGKLPPLDLERLKPITSTYLQLTRSMGLSDEDALRFDNLVSEDFDYKL